MVSANNSTEQHIITDNTTFNIWHPAWQTCSQWPGDSARGLHVCHHVGQCGFPPGSSGPRFRRVLDRQLMACQGWTRDSGRYFSSWLARDVTRDVDEVLRPDPHPRQDEYRMLLYWIVLALHFILGVLHTKMTHKAEGEQNLSSCLQNSKHIFCYAPCFWFNLALLAIHCMAQHSDIKPLVSISKHCHSKYHPHEPTGQYLSHQAKTLIA